jgi:hypothetical protein
MDIPHDKRQIGRRKHRWEGSVGIIFKEVGSQEMNYE